MFVSNCSFFKVHKQEDFTSVIVVIMIKPVFEKLLIELSLVLGVQGEGETIASHC